MFELGCVFREKNPAINFFLPFKALTLEGSCIPVSLNIATLTLAKLYVIETVLTVSQYTHSTFVKCVINFK